MDEEDVPIHEHPFFQHLQKSNVLDQACKKGYIIALPPARSLPPNVPFTRDFSLSHILLPSKRTQGQHKIFHTLLSRTLILRGDTKSSLSTLCTVSTRTTSWPERREVAILSEETYYTENFENFPIFHISLPLYGPIDQQYLTLIHAQTLSKLDPIQRAFNDHVMVILTTLGDEALPTITQQTQALLQQLKTTYQLIRNFEANLHDKIDSFCATLLVGILSTLKHQQQPQQHHHHHNGDIPVVHTSSIMKQSDGFPLSKKNWSEIILAVHYLTATKLSSYITRRLSEIYHEENNILYNAALWSQFQLQQGNHDGDGPDLHHPMANLSTSLYHNTNSLVFLLHPTQNHPHPNVTPPQIIPSLPSNPLHPFFIQIGLRVELSCVDFSIPALKLREVLSTVQYHYDHQPHQQPTELYQPALMLQSGLLEVNQLIQNAVINHYTSTSLQPSPSSPFHDDTSIQHNAPDPSSPREPATLGQLSLQPNLLQIQNSIPAGTSSSPLQQQQQQQPPDKVELSSELKAACAISAEDLIPLILYLLVIAPTYTIHSQCVYLCTFSPISLASTNGGSSTEMGYAKNNVGLPSAPAQNILPVSKIESLCISLRAAVGQLYQLYSTTVPNQVYLLQQTHFDRPPAHTNVIRVANQTLRTSSHTSGTLGLQGYSHHTLSRVGSSHGSQGGINTSAGSVVGGGGLSIFAGNPGSSGSPPINPLSPTNALTGGFLPHNTKANGLQHQQQLQPQQSQHTVNITHASSLLNNNRATTLTELDNDLVKRLQAESIKLDEQHQQKTLERDDEDDDFLATLM